MEHKNHQISNNYDEEKNFIEIIKLLIKNKKLILKITGVSLVVGVLLYLTYNQIKPLHMEQKFYLSYIDKMEEMEIAGVPVAPELAFKDDKFIDMFFEKEFVKKSFTGISDKERRKFIQSKLDIKMEKIKVDKFLYTLTTKGKSINESKVWASTYFELLNKYIEKQNRAKLDEEYLKFEKKSESYNKKLDNLQNKITELVELEKKENYNGIISLADEMKQKYPRVFSEKDAYSQLYNDVLVKKENLSQFLDFLDSNIEFRSSLVESEGKINLLIAIIISITFGALSGTIFVIGKNYFKGINWE